MNELKWFYENGELKGTIPRDCVEDCSCQGDNTAMVKDWAEQLDFQVPREQAIKYLSEFGMDKDFNEASQDDLNEYSLWIACGDISEQGEWYGLIH